MHQALQSEINTNSEMTFYSVHNSLSIIS